eukprot:GILJ01016536.1.p1 GENE.GILJ01016536.1~~GILJ01016536.1.p1  ORF type:complete len:299 (-),score=58.89 GILJ01016536.1:143-1039(-)
MNNLSGEHSSSLSLSMSASTFPLLKKNEGGGYSFIRSAHGAQQADDSMSRMLKTKLATLSERFTGFDRAVEEDTIRRKTVEESKVHDIRETLLKVEKAMNSEIKRRVEANRALQSLIEQMVNKVMDKLQASFIRKLERVQENVESLTRRGESLEQNVKEWLHVLPKKLQAEIAAVVSAIGQLRQGIEADKKVRVEKDTHILKRLGEAEYKVDKKFELEHTDREGKVNNLQMEVERTGKLKATGDDKFRIFVMEELTNLKNNLLAEAHSRTCGDDEIVQALNHYTNALQQGLRSVNVRY